MSKTRDENVVETMVVGNTEFRLVLEQDDDPICPWEDWDTLGTLVTWHRRLSIGHEQPKVDADQWIADLADVDPDWYHEWWSKRTPKSGVSFQDALNKRISGELDRKGIVILPVYAYEHGGITISTGSFNCPWDSGQLGYIYATKDKILESLGREKGRRLGPKDKARAREIMESEVETFDQYLMGDVWYWKVEETSIDPQTSEGQWSLVESCYGIYGYEDAVADGKIQLKSIAQTTEGKI